MFDFGWAELLLIGAIALIVVGPKDLPGMLRTLGQYAGKARGMAREFQRTMDEAAREADMSGLNDIRKGFSDVKSAVNPMNAAEKWMGDDFPDAPKQEAPKAGDPANAPLPVKPADPAPSPLTAAEQQVAAEQAKKRAIEQARQEQEARASAPKDA